MDKSMLYDATSSDDKPVPGYLLQDIAKQTLSSYPACQQLEEYLVARLAKDNHNIKYKCLVICKAVCRTGRADFKKDMARQVQPIKDCLQYRGPPDPLRGDEVYRRVRELARETLDAIFDSQMPSNTSAVRAQGRIQGMGGGSAPLPQATEAGGSGQRLYDAAMGRMGGGDDSSFSSMGDSRMDGAGGGGGGSGGRSFGNPNFGDPRLEKSWAERAADKVADGIIAGSRMLGVDSIGGQDIRGGRGIQGNGAFDPAFARQQAHADQQFRQGGSSNMGGSGGGGGATTTTAPTAGPAVARACTAPPPPRVEVEVAVAWLVGP